jgi:hypothetical protein
MRNVKREKGREIGNGELKIDERRGGSKILP